MIVLPLGTGSLRGMAVTTEGLRRWNVAMAALHALQAALILALSSDFALPVTAAFLEFDPTTRILEPELRTLFELRIGSAVAVFFLLSAVAHAAVAGPGLRTWYERSIGHRSNPARWIEYSLSASVMIVVIAMLVGVYDVGTLVALFGVTAAMMLFGWMMELHNQSTRSTDWTSFWFGAFAGAVPWVVVGIYLVGASVGAGGPPGFVYGIYASIFVFFNIFPLNMALQYRGRGRWSEYAYGEGVYMLLSLGAKSALGWQVFAGTLRPT